MEVVIQDLGARIQSVVLCRRSLLYFIKSPLGFYRVMHHIVKFVKRKKPFFWVENVSGALLVFFGIGLRLLSIVDFSGFGLIAPNHA